MQPSLPYRLGHTIGYSVYQLIKPAWYSLGIYGNAAFLLTNLILRYPFRSSVFLIANILFKIMANVSQVLEDAGGGLIAIISIIAIIQ